MVDIYRDAKLRGIYLPLFTDPDGGSCLSIRIFPVTEANQNARKLLSTDLVNTNIGYFPLLAGEYSVT